MAQPSLFSGNLGLVDDPRSAESQARRLIDQLSDDSLDAGEGGALVDEVFDKVAFPRIELKLDEERLLQTDVKVDVSHDFRRGGPVAPGTWMIDGFRLMVHIPFAGIPSLFNARTRSFTTRNPYGQVRPEGNDGGEVVFFVDVPADLPEEKLADHLRREKEDNTNLLIRYVEFVNKDVDAYNTRLKQELTEALARRLELRLKKQRLRDELGIPTPDHVANVGYVVPVASAPHSVSSTQPIGTPPEHRDFFACHASEDKDFVRTLYNSLISEGALVWFDDYEIQVGDSLRVKIEHGLKISTYGIVIISPRLIAKNGRGWIQREIGGLMARQDREHPSILPVWHETSATDVAQHLPSLADTVALDASKMTIEEVAKALWRRKLSDQS